MDSKIISTKKVRPYLRSGRTYIYIYVEVVIAFLKVDTVVVVHLLVVIHPAFPAVVAPVMVSAHDEAYADGDHNERPEVVDGYTYNMAK